MDRRDFLAKLSSLAAVGLATQVINPQALSALDDKTKKMNVLFIAVDDLRPQLGCYGQKQMVTPNLDRLAGEGALFMRTYCQQAVCSPTRSSLLTGTRPDTTKVYDLVTHFRAALPDVVTLPQHFKNNGYHSVGIGKIYHGSLNDPPSWSEPWIQARGRGYVLEESFESGPQHTPAPGARKSGRKGRAGAQGRRANQPQGFVKGLPYECADVPDTAYTDGQTADQAIQILKRIKDKPFFLGVGFIKPHLPFNAPKKYWDLYDPAKIDLADNPFAPKGCPPMAMHDSGELRTYQKVPPKGPIPDDLARKLIHGYYAATSFTDAQIGRVVQALEDEGLKDNTVVIVWGDHGWHLGDHGLWCKHSNFERATHACMMMRVPGKKPGVKVTGLTEFVDIYPTLCDLTGLAKPAHLEGTSFAPLLDAPERPWKKAAFSQYPRKGHMGYSLRTERYRYTEWRKNNTGEVAEVELYDYTTDPAENVNLAAEAGHEELLRGLAARMKAGWQGARP